MTDDRALARFRLDLDRLLPSGRLGVAVSGGPDSLALLLLAAATRPGEVEAATVDHGLRAGSAEEAEAVAAVSERLHVRHCTLRVTVADGSSLQAQAREARYEALERWALERGLAAIATAHHADDQAETLLMRLTRGAGLSGLAGVRERRSLGELLLIRPLLRWRKAELVAIVAGAGVMAAEDPSNADPRHDRTRIRQLLAEAPLLDVERLAASAGHLSEAEEALSYAAGELYVARAKEDHGAILLRATDLPRELKRRLVLLAIERLGAAAPRGPDLDRALQSLNQGRACTLGSLKLEGGAVWRLSPAPPRRLSSRPAGS